MVRSAANPLQVSAMSKVKPKVDEEKLTQLQTLLDAAKAARPSPADEERMAALVAEFLAGNKATLTLGVEALLKLPWSLAVKAVTEAWPNVKATGRKQFLALLEAQTSDEARRIRLSLSRGLVLSDAESAHKILRGVCSALLPEAESVLSNKDRQGIFNVLIGKGKPWLHHLDVATWEANDLLLLAQCVLQAAPISAPFTQEAVLRWASERNVLEQLSKPTMEMVITMLNRWPAKVRRELEKLPNPLPEAIAANLKEPSEPPQKPQPEKARPVQENAPAAKESAPPQDTAESAEPLPPAPVQAPRPERPAPRTTVVTVQRLEPKNHQPARQEFDLTANLRQIEQYVAKLKKELREAQTSREPRGRKRGGDVMAPAVSGAEVETLQRHNAQLEATVRELRERIEDLVQDHEDRAAILHQDDPLVQFKSLLALKLKEPFAEYSALRGQTPNDVLRQHYGDLLGHVFETLLGEGVTLDAK